MSKTLSPTQIDWDDAFANMAYVPGSDLLPSKWSEDAAKYLASGVSVDRDISYGPDPREVFDIIWPDCDPKGLAVFIHGGYWIRFDKSYWTHFAQGARQRGWAVAMPQYTCAPQARISQMTQQIGAAITDAAARVAGPIRIAGHSAGGHLAARMMCADSPLRPDVLERVEHTTSISGLHDLRPLMWTELNAQLRLGEPEACSESPALLRPTAGAQITAWVGADERPEFIRQAKLLALMWGGLEARVTCRIEDGHNHFSVIDGLKDAQSPITAAFVG